MYYDKTVSHILRYSINVKKCQQAIISDRQEIKTSEAREIRYEWVWDLTKRSKILKWKQ